MADFDDHSFLPTRAIMLAIWASISGSLLWAGFTDDWLAAMFAGFVVMLPLALPVAWLAGLAAAPLAGVYDRLRLRFYPHH
jgi:hypothetical protein